MVWIEGIHIADTRVADYRKRAGQCTPSSSLRLGFLNLSWAALLSQITSQRKWKSGLVEPLVFNSINHYVAVSLRTFHFYEQNRVSKISGHKLQLLK